jgi:hypothetical protein
MYLNKSPAAVTILQARHGCRKRVLGYLSELHDARNMSSFVNLPLTLYCPQAFCQHRVLFLFISEESALLQHHDDDHDIDARVISGVVWKAEILCIAYIYWRTTAEYALKYATQVYEDWTQEYIYPPPLSTRSRIIQMPHPLPNLSNNSLLTLPSRLRSRRPSRSNSKIKSTAQSNICDFRSSRVGRWVCCSY